MPDNNNSKLEQILSELPRVKREILENHLKTLNEEERESFVKEVIAEYESIKKIAQEKAPAPSQTSKETPVAPPTATKWLRQFCSRTQFRTSHSHPRTCVRSAR